MPKCSIEIAFTQKINTKQCYCNPPPICECIISKWNYINVSFYKLNVTFLIYYRTFPCITDIYKFTVTFLFFDI